jgi:hypothetical protein
MTDKLQICSKCQKEYRAEYHEFKHKLVDLSHGMCHACNLNRMSKVIKIMCDKCGQEFEARVWYIYDNVLKQDRIIRTISPSTCPDCVAKGHELAEAVFLSECAAIRLKWRQSSGIPPKFQNQDFNTFKLEKCGNTAKIAKVCQDYANGYPVSYRDYIKAQRKAYPSLVLFSAEDRSGKYDLAGVGKTHLACSIGHRLLDRWQGEEMYQDGAGKWLCRKTNPVLFVSEYEIYRKIQNTWTYSQEEKQKLDSELDIINQLIYRDLLILDDIGKEPRKDMDFVQRILFAIIDGRYKAMRPIVLTSNKDSDNLAAYLGQPSFDRIFEMTGGTLWQVEGKSYRQKEQVK